MRNVFWAFALYASIGADAAPAIDAAAIEAYSSSSEVRAIAISPSGQRAAFYSIDGNDSALFVVDLQTNEILLRFQLDKHELHSINFVHEDNVILFYEIKRFSGDLGLVSRLRIRVLDLRIERLDYLRAESFYGPAPHYSRLRGRTKDEQVFFVPSWVGTNHERLSMYKYHIEHGLIPKSVASGNHNTLSWLVGGNGEFFVREDFDPDRNKHTIHLIRGSDESVLYSLDTENRVIQVVGLESQGDSLIYRNILPGSDKMSYHMMNLTTGATTPAIHSMRSGRPLFDRDFAVLGFESGSYPTFEYEFLAPELAERFSAIESSLDGLIVRFVDCTDDFEHILVGASSKWSNSYYLLFSRGVVEPKVISADKRADNGQAIMSKIVQHGDDDGITVQARVTATDSVFAAKGSPTVVLANWPGHDFTSTGLFWAANFLASQGYVVVEPEIRGSYFDGTFLPHGVPSWSATPVDDVDLTLSGLAESGLIDAGRICIVGHDVGGFTALLAATESRFNFKCVVAIDGISKLEPLDDYISRVGFNKDPDIVYLEQVFDYDTRDRQSVKQRSPASHANKFHAPVLLLYSDKMSKRVELQMRYMAKALKKADKSVSLIAIKDEDVFLNRPDGRRQVLEQLSKFLDLYLPSDAPQ